MEPETNEGQVAVREEDQMAALLASLDYREILDYLTKPPADDDKTTSSVCTDEKTTQTDKEL